MTSAINTNGLDVNYPVPGVNNNSQGFRDNFATIKTNFTTTATELTDLQSKVVVKNALTGTIINNDMANTLISNAVTRSFRASTYNLGNSLSGTVTVNASLGDVQYGTVVGNVVLQFGAWAPSGTQSNVQLVLSVANAEAVISFPEEVVNTGSYGSSTLENYANVGNIATVTIPNDSYIVDYRFTTLDCGNTITVEPFNRPRQSTQIQQRTPAPTGYQGDVEGTVAIDTSYLYVCTDSFDSGGTNSISKTATATYSSNNEVVLNNINSLVTNNPIVFSGTALGSIVPGSIYYIKSIVSGNSSVTLSETRTAGVAGSTYVLTLDTSTTTLAISYNGSNIWKRISLTSW